MWFCKVCGTEAETPTLCSGCGGLMTATTGKHTYAVEVVDLPASYKAGEAVVYERRGPFHSVSEATDWWHRHEPLARYRDCTAFTVIVEGVGEHYD